MLSLRHVIQAFSDASGRSLVASRNLLATSNCSLPPEWSCDRQTQCQYKEADNALQVGEADMHCLYASGAGHLGGTLSAPSGGEGAGCTVQVSHFDFVTD